MSRVTKKNAIHVTGKYESGYISQSNNSFVHGVFYHPIKEVSRVQTSYSIEELKERISELQEFLEIMQAYEIAEKIDG